MAGRDEELNRLVRRLLRDEPGAVWTDGELAAMQDKALEEYSLDTGCARGCFGLTVDRESRGVYPEDYLMFLAGFSQNGQKITSSSIHALRRAREYLLTGEGMPEAIAEDLSAGNGYRLFPNSYAVMGTIEYDASGRGVAIDGLGLFGEGGPGLLVSAVCWEPAGEVQYVRRAALSEVPDLWALAFNMAAQAYAADSEFANSELAVAWRSRYQGRCAYFSNLATNGAVVRRGGTFF